MRILILLTSLILASAAPGRAAEPPKFTLTIQNHRFEPTELEVPSGQKIELHVINQDSTAEEFESTDLHREKVVPGGKEITLFIGPLRPGRYEFFGDFNPKTARGFIVAR
jgi:hypothetical protein